MVDGYLGYPGLPLAIELRPWTCADPGDLLRFVGVVARGGGGGAVEPPALRRLPYGSVRRVGRAGCGCGWWWGKCAACCSMAAAMAGSVELFEVEEVF
eukprot:scaffold116743_cov33-Tisochrysis_lutea.AAC.1